MSAKTLCGDLGNQSRFGNLAKSKRAIVSDRGCPLILEGLLVEEILSQVSKGRRTQGRPGNGKND